MLNPHWGRGATGKQKKSCIVLVQLFATLWTVTHQASLSSGLSRQEYWSVLAHIGCLTLLEHYISCFPSHQHPWVPGADITPATQAAELPPYPAFTGTGPSPSGQPQEQTPADNPHAEVEIKPQWNPGVVWLKKKTQNLPTSCISWRLNPHDQLGRLCL